MRHVPHLYLPGPWERRPIAVPADTARHLERVLRMTTGQVSYTDGAGTSGTGVYSAGMVDRGDERPVPEPRPAVTLAVAPPKAADRQRFIVEKATELGVRQLVWLSTRYTEGRPPPASKAQAWAIAALEQSRGLHLMAVDERATALESFEPDGQIMVCDPAGEELSRNVDAVTVLVGPEGGFSVDEVRPGWRRVSLGERTLRTETAAIAAAAILLAGKSPATD